MGRKSYELHSRPGKEGLFHQLEHEQTHQIIKIVVSTTWQPSSTDVIFCQSWTDVKEAVFQLRQQITEAWNIGGPQLYETHLIDFIGSSNEKNYVYLTRLDQAFSCDVFYPIKYLAQLTLVDQSEEKQENGVKFIFSILQFSPASSLRDDDIGDR